MSPILISLVSVAYAWTGVEQALKDNWWFAGMWIFYAGANLCLMKAGAIG